MIRIPSFAFTAAIEHSLGSLPAGIRHRVEHADFLCGVDPVYAGLHRFEAMSYGRSYRSVAHCSWRMHSSDGRTTIVLPVVEDPIVIVHELGHVLHEQIGWQHVAEPVTVYAKDGPVEAFAEALTAYLVPGYGERADGATMQLWRDLE